MTLTTQDIKDRAQAQLIVSAASIVLGIPHFDVFSRRRLPANDMILRQTSMYLLNTSCNYSQSHVARIFERDRGTVRQACAIVEDMRDNLDFDEKLNTLEFFLAKDPRLIQVV